MSVAKKKNFYKCQFVGRKKEILRENKPLLLWDFDPLIFQQTTESCRLWVLTNHSRRLWALTQKELERLLCELPWCQALDRHFLVCHLNENKIQLWGALSVQKNLTVANVKRSQISTLFLKKRKSKAKSVREIVEEDKKSTLKCSSLAFSRVPSTKDFSCLCSKVSTSNSFVAI